MSFTIKGIGGLSIGDAFKVSYIPQQYRNLMHFIVKGMDNNIGPNGWKTKIKAQMIPEYGEPEKTKIDTTDMVIQVSKQYLKSLGYSHEQIAMYGEGGHHHNDIEAFLTHTPKNYVAKEDKAGTGHGTDLDASNKDNAKASGNPYQDVDPEILKEFNRVNKEMEENENNATIDEFNKSFTNENGQSAAYVKTAPNGGDAQPITKKDCDEMASQHGYSNCQAFIDTMNANAGMEVYKVQG